VIFHARYRRALARIEAELSRADPGLATQFERFNARVAASAPAGGQMRLRVSSRRVFALMLLPLTAMVALWIAVSLSGSEHGAGDCATPLGSACLSGRPGCQPAGAAAGNQPASVPPPAASSFAVAVGGVAVGSAAGAGGVPAATAAGRVPAGAGHPCPAHPRLPR
jgi:hypothetical protein